MLCRPWRRCRSTVVVKKAVVVWTWCMRCSRWLRPIVVISYLHEYFTRALVHLEGWAWVQKRSLRFRQSDDRAAHFIWYYSSSPFHLNRYRAVRKWRRLWPNSLIPQSQEGGLDRLRTEHKWAASIFMCNTVIAVSSLPIVVDNGSMHTYVYSSVACADKCFGERWRTSGSERQTSFAVIIESIASACSKHSTFTIKAPYQALPSLCNNIYQYNQTRFRWGMFPEVLRRLPQTLASSASLIQSVVAYATTKLTASHLPANSKCVDTSRLFMNWRMCTNVRHIGSLTAGSTLLLFLLTWAKRLVASRTECGTAGSPSLLQYDEATVKWLALRQ